MAGRQTNLSVSIIIPVHDGGTDFQRCLASAAACVPPAREVIVVDDASRDESWAVAAGSGVRCVQLPEQRGPAYARNRGAELATGNILFFVDADVALAPDATAQVLDAFAREPHVTAVFGSYDDAPAAPNFLSRYKNLLHHYVHQTSSEDASTFWAACGAVRRDVFVALGGFDERYRRPSIEDIELGSRLRRAGHIIRLRTSLRGKHLKRWTAVSLLTADIRDRALPWTALMLQDGALVNDLNLQWSSRVSAIAVLAVLPALAGGWWWHALWALASGLVVLLLLLNAPLYVFFVRTSGVAFALGCVGWHWLYYLYSSIVFGLAVCAHAIARRAPGRDSQPPLSAPLVSAIDSHSSGAGRACGR